MGHQIDWSATAAWIALAISIIKLLHTASSFFRYTSSVMSPPFIFIAFVALCNSYVKKYSTNSLGLIFNKSAIASASCKSIGRMLLIF